MNSNTNIYLRLGNNQIVICTELIASLAILGNSISGILRFICYKISISSIYGTYTYMALMLIVTGIYCFRNSGFFAKIIKYLLIVIIIYGLSYLNFNYTHAYFVEYESDLIYLIIIAIPGVVALSVTEDFERILHASKHILRICTVLMFIFYFLGALAYFNSMQWGMRILPLAIMYLLYNKSFPSKLDKIFMLLSIFMCLLGGRQSLIIIFVCILSVAVLGNNDNQRKLFIIIGIVLVGAFCAVFYNSLIHLLQNLLSTFHIASRSLESLTSESLFDTGTRTSIFNYCKTIIEEKGSTVSGIFADRYFLRQYRSNIAYAHNIVLEIIIDFGTIIGPIILILFTCVTIKNYIKTESSRKVIFACFFALGIIRYLVSGSIFIEPFFWYFLAVCNNKRMLRIEQETIDYEEN